MKAISVARVSTEEQREAGNSLPAQVERIKSYSIRKGFEIIKSFSFDESAYKEKRDEFDRLLDYVEKASRKEKVAVCFDKVDRLSRSIFDKRVAQLYDMAIADKIELHFVSEGQVIDQNMNAGDKFSFGMKLGLAKYYSDAISDNVKRAFEQKRRNGEWTGFVRLGYLNVEGENGKRDIIIDTIRGHIIKKMFELYSTGQHSFKSIREEAIKLGLTNLKGKKPSKSAIFNILNDSFFCGTAMSKKYGNYTHKYPRLISRELFDQCQKVSEKRKITPSKPQSRQFVLKGLVKCKNCSCTVTAEHKTKPSGLEYDIYSCTNGRGICKREYVNETHLLKPVYEVLERFESIPEYVVDELIADLRKNVEAEKVFNKSQITRIRKDYDALQEKDNRLLEAYLDQSITKDLYDKKHQEIQDEIQTLEIEMSEHRQADFDYQTTIATVLSVARRAKTIFDNSSETAEKRAFLSKILQNPVLKDKELHFELKKPFNSVLNLADYISAQSKTTSKNARRLAWLGRQDSNL